MRLDSIGKPPAIPNDSFEPAKIAKLKVEQVGKIDPPEGMETSGDSTKGEQRLGKILSLIKKAQEEKEKKKKRSSGNRVSDGLKVYQKLSAPEPAEQPGQTLNVKV